MNRGQGTIASLLAVIAVLLGLHLTAKESPAAKAGPVQTVGPTEPYIVQITASSNLTSMGGTELYRLWSDGAIDMWLARPTNFKEGPDWFNFLTGEIGSSAWWGWVPLGPVQRADLNADGCVDVVDFLSLLADWNPCL